MPIPARSDPCHPSVATSSATCSADSTRRLSPGSSRTSTAPAAPHRLILYGVDRTIRAALVERHLGRPLDSFAGEVASPRPVAPTLRSSERTVRGRTVSSGENGARSRVDDSGSVGSTSGDGGGDRSPAEGPSRSTRRHSGRRIAVAIVLALVLAAGLAGVLVVGVPGPEGDRTPTTVPEGTPSNPPRSH